jgi:hypothetical protein
MTGDGYRLTKGIKQNLVLQGSKRDIQVTKFFSRFFGVTFSKEGRFKRKTDYTMVFLQPSETMQLNFNLSNEMLLLFSQYPKFDTRTFDLVDKTLEDYSNRLDKLCVIIVSEDASFIDEISRLIEAQSDFRLIVPFLYDEILSSNYNETKIYNRMRKFLYSRDLFALESPLQKDDYFFGRSHVVQQLLGKYLSGEQSGLFGLRKIGKTSVLYALQRTLIHRNGKSLFIDCQSPAVHMKKWYQLLEYIVIEFSKRYDLYYFFKSISYNEGNAASRFEKDIGDLYDLLEKQRILLIFDEIENISYSVSMNEHWKSGNDFLYFWQTIRSVYQKNPNILSFVIAGVNPTIVEIPLIQKSDNPIFGMIKSIYLDFFELSDIKHMVSRIGGYMGLQFDEEIFTYLVEDYGGHPFLTRQVCSLINKTIKDKPSKVDKYLYKGKKENFDTTITPYVDQIISVLENWYPHELKLLSILAAKGNTQFQQEINSKNEINHLLGYGIVVKYKNSYNITINAVSKYAQKVFIDNSIPDNLDEKWASISKRRNKIEINIREIIKNALQSNLGKASTKNILLGVKNSSIRDTIKTNTVSKILEDYFYFPDYIVVISKNWKYFENIFADKSDFIMCMKTINEYRVDAHAKQIDDATYFRLDYALKWIIDAIE